MSVDIILYAHESIRAHVKAANRLLRGNDRTNAKKLIDNLNQDLNKHFDFEEEELPGLIGDLLMEPIVADHRNITRQMQEIARHFGQSVHTESLDMNALSVQLQGLIEALLEHCETEDAMLKLLRRHPSRRLLV